MKTKIAVLRMAAVSASVILGSLLLAGIAAGHCDTLDGPVVIAAKGALEKSDVTPVLKWVKKENEAETRGAFEKTLLVRAKGPEAKELADMYFFETLVRLHRAGEGAPYTGLKPAGSDLGPAVAEADKALEKGDVDALVKLLTRAVVAGIRQRFAQAVEAKKHAEESVEAGREFVAAYVEFVHYAERLFQDAVGESGHRAEAEGATAEPVRHVEGEGKGTQTEHHH